MDGVSENPKLKWVLNDFGYFNFYLLLLLVENLKLKWVQISSSFFLPLIEGIPFRNSQWHRGTVESVHY